MNNSTIGRHGVKKWLVYLVAVVVCESAGLIGSIFTASAIPTWYAGLVKPTFNPPAWIFGPVWTVLYFLMGIAVALIWQKKITFPVTWALRIFAAQLVLNILWSIVFFGWRSPGAAVIEIVFLWLSIMASIVTFAKISKLAAWLLVPYILWVSFAAFLNFTIYSLN